jgi:hypothetical protein
MERREGGRYEWVSIDNLLTKPKIESHLLSSKFNLFSRFSSIYSKLSSISLSLFGNGILLSFAFFEFFLNPFLFFPRKVDQCITIDWRLPRNLLSLQNSDDIRRDIEDFFAFLSWVHCLFETLKPLQIFANDIDWDKVSINFKQQYDIFLSALYKQEK